MFKKVKRPVAVLGLCLLYGFISLLTAYSMLGQTSRKEKRGRSVVFHEDKGMN